MATGDASPGQRGRSQPRSSRRKALRRREFCGPQSVTQGCGLGEVAQMLSQLTYHKDADTNQETAAKSPSWGSGDLRLALAGPWAGFPRVTLLPPTGSRTLQVYSRIGLDEAFRLSQPQAGPDY